MAYINGKEAFFSSNVSYILTAKQFEALKAELKKSGQVAPEFANSIEECTDTTKLYVLPDGYIYAYCKVFEENNEYNPTTAKFNARINSSGVEKTYNGALLIDRIKVEYDPECVVTIKGIDHLTSNYASYFAVDYFDKSGNWMGQRVGEHFHFVKVEDTLSLPISFNIFNPTASTSSPIDGIENVGYVSIKLGIGADEQSISALDCEGLVVNFSTKNGVVSVPLYTNLAEQAGWTWAIDQRTNSSCGYTAEVGTIATDYIPCTVGDVVRVKGLDIFNRVEGAGSYATAQRFTSDKSPIDTGSMLDARNSGAATVVDGDTVVVDYAVYENCAYMRFCGVLFEGYTIDDVIVTVNEEIEEIETDPATVYKWTNTGHAFVPADYEDRILGLENESKEQGERITELERNATNGGAVVIPTFWEDAVNETVNKIKALQVGKNCVTFPFFSDNHARNGYAGMLIAHIMKECGIPYAFFGGDAITSGYCTEAEMIEQDKAFDAVMAYIPNGRFCRAVGNHDGFWNDNGTKHAYTREQIYELFLREESTAQNKNFGDDGTYYYVDDMASKVRFVVLNTNRANDPVAGAEMIDSAQLSWLQNTALSFSASGWGVVIISHCPVTNHYHGNISNAAELVAAVKAANVDIIGWFSGHIHRDRIYTGFSVNDNDDTEGTPLGFKQVTITSDHTSIAYEDATKHAVANDDKSHAIDFITVNKATRTVNITRLGIGNDRSYTY